MAEASVLEEKSSTEEAVDSWGKNFLDLLSDRLLIQFDLSTLLHMEEANVSTRLAIIRF